VRSLQDQIPALGTRGTIITKEVINQVASIIRQNRILLAGSTFMAAGLLTLLPTVIAITVNILGFTAGGVLQGTKYLPADICTN
jgi:hypothetical protein